MNGIGYSLALLALAFLYVGWRARDIQKRKTKEQNEASVAQAVASIFSVIGGGEYGFALSMILIYGFGGPAFLLGLAAAVLLLRPFVSKIWQEAIEKEGLATNLDGYKNFSTPDWLAHTYGMGAGRLATGITGIAFLALLTLQFVLGADLISAVTGWHYVVSVMFMAALVAAYVCLGGFAALLHTDLFQGILMWLALVVTLVWVFGFQQPAGEHTAALSDLAGKTNAAFANGLSDPTMLTMFLVTLVAAFGGPDIWQRIGIVNSPKNTRASLLISGITWLVFLIPLSLLAVDMAAANLPADSEDPFRDYINLMCGGEGSRVWPVGIAAIFACGLLAAFVSTADTCALLLSSALQNEWHRRSSELTVKLNRRSTNIIIVVVCAISAGFAILEPNVATQFAGVIGILSVMGATTFCSLVGRGNASTSLIGMSLGVAIALTLTYLTPHLNTGYLVLLPMVPPLLSLLVERKPGTQLT